MKIQWRISKSEIHKLNQFMMENKNPFTEKRWQRNVEKKNIFINEDTIIHVMIMCLLSSQQRSGPNTPLGHFLIKDPHWRKSSSHGMFDGVTCARS